MVLNSNDVKKLVALLKGEPSFEVYFFGKRALHIVRLNDAEVDHIELRFYDAFVEMSLTYVEGKRETRYFYPHPQGVYTHDTIAGLINRIKEAVFEAFRADPGDSDESGDSTEPVRA